MNDLTRICLVVVLVLAVYFINEADAYPYHHTTHGYYNLPNDYYFSPFMPYYNNHNDVKYYEDMTRDHDNRGEFKQQYYETYNNPFLQPYSLSPYLNSYRSITITDNCWYWGC